MSDLIRKLLYTIHHHHLIPPDSRLVVAVSGGADSMAMLHLLFRLRQRLAYHLHVATLDHGLRGEESAADAEFVRQTAEAWGLPVTVGKADLDPYAPGIEAQAREARYAFLAETAQSVSASRIAVAHHADDQAETVLMHLIRGGSVHGLSGMAYSRILFPHLSAFNPHPLTLIRPMLDITRAEIEAYCAEYNIAYRHDSTNDQPKTLRNRLRLETVPHLSQLNPQIVPALNRLAKIAAAEDDYLERETARFIAEHGTHKAQNRIVLNRDAFRALHRALQRRVIAQIAHESDFEHIERAVDLMQTAAVGKAALLPNGWQVRMGYAELYVEQSDAPDTLEDYLLPAGFEIAVNLPGVTITPQGWQLTIEEATFSDEGIMLTIPLNASVMLRTRRPGDRVAPKGLGGHTRKLKDWMIDRKIPQRLREQLPLFIVNGEIAAVLSQSEWYITEPFTFGYNPATLHTRHIRVKVAKI